MSVRRSWASHEDGQHNEMIDTVDAIFIHSTANLAISVSMQWSHDEIVSAIVMFRICRQLLGPAGEFTSPRPLVPRLSFRLLFDALGPTYKISYDNLTIIVR